MAQKNSLAKQIGMNLLNATPLTKNGRADGMAEIMPYLRGGLIDLQNAFAQALPDSRQQASVLGMAGVPTPGAVDREQGKESPGAATKGPAADVRKSILGYTLPAPEQGKEQEQGREL